jgi:ABC-type branched-subunit amino acid transport system substrate-binding protein
MKKKDFGILLAVCFLVFGLPFSALAEEGVTDTTIRIGQWGPQTGPVASWGSVARGTGVYFQMINDEGGINGRKIEYSMFDDGYNPAKTKAGVKELQEGKGMFGWACGVGSAPGLAVKDYLMEKKIPWVGPAAGSLNWITPPQKYLFAVYPLYYTEAQLLVRYGLKTMGKKKVAIVYQNDDYGKNGVQGAEKEAAKNGIKLVAQVPAEVADTDMKPHVTELKKADADVVLLWVGPAQAVRIIGTAQAMQYKPQWMSTSTCSDFPLMQNISKGLWTDAIVAFFGEVPESTAPLMLKYKKAFDKFAAKDERWGVFFYAGIGFVEPMVEGLKRCGRDLTRERFVKEMEGIKNFKGIFGRIDYSAFEPSDVYSRQGQKAVFLAQCLADGKSKILTDWMEP